MSRWIIGESDRVFNKDNIVSFIICKETLSIDVTSVDEEVEIFKSFTSISELLDGFKELLDELQDE